MDYKSVKILVVDDEEIYTNILDHILSPVYTVYIANSGQEAIRLAKEVSPDLILLDVMLPDMTGFEVFEELKKDDMAQDIRVIFITGLNNTKDEEKGLFLGAVDYIAKPFFNSIVLARIRTHAQVIRHIRTIEEMCLLDALTGLPNRRAFDLRLEQEWGRAARSQEPLSLIYIDMDKFKFYNDTYGHPFGDIVLQTVAGIFSRTLKRSTDLATRWGGDEFAILLPNTNLDGACQLAEQIRQTVEKTGIPLNNKTINITTSMGVHSITPSAGDLTEHFLADTDKKLYAAKEGGRNRLSSQAEPAPAASATPAANRKADDIPKAAAAKAVVTAESTIAESAAETQGSSDIMERLRNFPMLDAVQAVEAIGGSEELYIKVMRLTANGIPQNIRQLGNNLFKDSDLDKFNSTVHSIKVSMNQIGYREPIRLAESLESASASGDSQYCKEQYSAFRKTMMLFQEEITKALQEGGQAAGQLAEIDSDIRDYKDELSRAKEAADSYDSISAYDILSPLKKRHFDGNIDTLISEAADALEAFQPQKAAGAISELLKECEY